MTDINISSRMMQALGNPQAQGLVNKILADGKVDKVDKDNLDQLKSILEGAAIGDDGEIDSQEKELIGALTNRNYVLGVNLGTSDTILTQNLKQVKTFQALQQSGGLNPNEVSFEGLTLTTDGWLGDDKLVLHLQDFDIPPTTQDSQGTQPAAETNATAATTGNSTASHLAPAVTAGAVKPATAIAGGVAQQVEATAGPAQTDADIPVQVPVGAIAGETSASALPVTQAIQAQPTYTAKPVPAPGAVPDLPEVQNPAQTEPQRVAHLNNVSRLQSDTTQVRNLLNDPQQVTDQQLQESLKTFASKDPGRALDELSRFKPELLDQLKSEGSLSKQDYDTIQTQLKTKNWDLLEDLNLQSGQALKTVLTSHLQQNPLSAAELNAYRTELVRTADAYIEHPSQENFAQAEEQLYQRLYTFESGASPPQEAAYRSFAASRAGVIQSQDSLLNQTKIVNGTQSTLVNNAISSGNKLVQHLENNNSTVEAGIAGFSKEIATIVKYLEDNPGQYAGQSDDIASLQGKVSALKSESDPQKRLDLLNQLNTQLDGVRVKSKIGEGASGFSNEEIRKQLTQLQSNTTDPAELQAINFLIKNPELLQAAPKVEQYAATLEHLNNKQEPLSMAETDLKQALESGNVMKVNGLYFNSMMSGMPFIPFIGIGGGNPEDSLEGVPGDWGSNSDLADLMSGVSPERRSELILALQSPEAASINSAINSSTGLSGLVARLQGADQAQVAHNRVSWNENSDIQKLEQNIQKQVQDRAAIETQLQNSLASLDNMIGGDIASEPVKAKLREQKVAIEQALQGIQNGTLTAEAATKIPGLDAALSGLADGSIAGVKPETAMLKRATLDALAEMNTRPVTQESMAKLEAYLRQQPDFDASYSHIFATNENKEYQFLGDVQGMLENSKLDSNGLNLLLTQANRSMHLIDGAGSKIDDLKTTFEAGQRQLEAGSGEGEFYSGFMSMKNLNQMQSVLKAQPYLDSSDVLNQAGAKAQKLASHSGGQVSDRQLRTQVSQMFQAEMKEISQGASKSYIDNILNDKERNANTENLHQLFGSNNPSAQAAVAQLRAEIKTIDPSIDVSKINSVESLQKQLTPAQIAQLQTSLNNAVAKTPGLNSAEVKNSIQQLSQAGLTYKPGMPTTGLSTQQAATVTRLNEIHASNFLKEISATDLTNVREMQNNNRQMQDNLNLRLGDMNTALISAEIDLRASNPTAANAIYNGLPALPAPSEPTFSVKLKERSEEINRRANQYLHQNQDLRIRDRALIAGTADIANDMATVADFNDFMQRGETPPESLKITAALALSNTMASTAFISHLINAPTEADADRIRNDYLLARQESTSFAQSGGLAGGAEIPETISAGGQKLIEHAQGNLQIFNDAVRVQTAIKVESGFNGSGSNPAAADAYNDYEALHGTAVPVTSTGTTTLETYTERAEPALVVLAAVPASELNAFAVAQADMRAKSGAAMNGFENDMAQMILSSNDNMIALGYPPLDIANAQRALDNDLSFNSSVDNLDATVAKERAAVSKNTQTLIEDANRLGSELILATQGANSDELLSKLMRDMAEIIQEADAEIRQLIMARLALKMMDEMIGAFYKEQGDRLNKDHETALHAFSNNMKNQIDTMLQKSEENRSNNSENTGLSATSLNQIMQDFGQLMEMTRTDPAGAIPMVLSNEQENFINLIGQMINAAGPNSPDGRDDAQALLAFDRQLEGLR